MDSFAQVRRGGHQQRSVVACGPARYGLSVVFNITSGESFRIAKQEATYKAMFTSPDGSNYPLRLQSDADYFSFRNSIQASYRVARDYFQVTAIVSQLN